MGAFNELIIGPDDEARVQFKHGLCWQIEYRVGDKINWENTTRPSDADHEIIVPGIGGGEHPREYAFYKITIKNDYIISAEEITKSEHAELEKKHYR